MRPHWPALDGLRAIAVLLVIGFHAGNYVHNGFVGVDVFFVLSGFLITTLLLREHEQTGTIALPAFYLRRVLRLYPALVVVCVGVTAGALVIGDHFADVAKGAVVSLLYVANIWEFTPGHNTHLLQHTWTLALEEQFYVLWPALLALILRWRAAAYVIGASWLAVEACDALLGQPPVLHTYVRAAGLPLGCVLAFALRNRAAPRVDWLAFACLAAIVVVALLPAHLGAWLEGWPLGAVNVLTVPVVIAAIGTGATVTLLSHPALVWIGRRSYGLYLWHFPITSVALNNTSDSIPLALRATAGVAATFMVAALSYVWIEQPFLRRKERLTTGSR